MQKQDMSSSSMTFWNNLDPAVVSSLTSVQKAEILTAVDRRASKIHPADVRLSLFGYFLVVIFGRECRSDERRISERNRHPVFVHGNFFLILILWGSVLYTSFSVVFFSIRKLLILFL